MRQQRDVPAQLVTSGTTTLYRKPYMANPRKLTIAHLHAPQLLRSSCDGTGWGRGGKLGYKDNAPFATLPFHEDPYNDPPSLVLPFVVSLFIKFHHFFVHKNSGYCWCRPPTSLLPLIPSHLSSQWLRHPQQRAASRVKAPESASQQRR